MDLVGADPDDGGALVPDDDDGTPPIGVEPRPDRAQRRLLLAGTPSTRRSAGALIVAVGALTVFVAVYWLPTNAARYDVPARPWPAVTALLVGVSLANVVAYGRRGSWLPGLRTAVILAAAVIVLSGFVAAWAVDYTQAIAATGYPDAVGPVTLVGCALVALGAVLAVGSGERSRRITTQAWAIAGSVAVGTIVTTIVIAASAGDWTVSSHTLDEGRVAATPTAVDSARWRRTEDGGDAAAAGPGIVIAVGDLISGISAGDGTERWFYRRSGADIERVVASPDGTTVYAELAEFDPDGNGMLVFDAITGRLRFATNRRIDDDGANVADSGVIESGITSSGVLRLVQRPARSAAGGWTWQDGGCSTPAGEFDTSPTVAVTGDSVVAVQHCRSGWRLVALDAGTGGDEWRAELGVADDVRLDVDAGLGVVTTVADEGAPEFRDLVSGSVLAVSADGYDSGGLLVVTDARHVPTSVLDPTTGVRWALSPALDPVVDRAGTVLALDEQLITAPLPASPLSAVQPSTVERAEGRATTLDADLPAGDRLRLLAGPGAVFAVVQSGNGELSITALVDSRLP
jgi:hypothetical protein